jgi:hypothetical protein
MMFPAKKQAIVDAKADCEGAGMTGGQEKRDRAVTELSVSSVALHCGPSSLPVVELHQG